MNIFKKKVDICQNNRLPTNEAYNVSHQRTFFTILILMASGAIMATAFPPLNWSCSAFLGIVFLIYVSITHSYKAVAFYGYIWAISWILCAFWWLREIDLLVPFILALVMGAWWIVISLMIKFSFSYLIFPQEILSQGFSTKKSYLPPIWRSLLFLFFISSIWCFSDYSRVNLFPWNFIGVSLWKNLYLIQNVEYTGIYLLTFLIVFVNGAVALTIFYLQQNIEKQLLKKFLPTIISLILLIALHISGYFILQRVDLNKNNYSVLFGAIQGDISQRRNSNSSMAKEALDIYIQESNKLIKNYNPQIIIWPETAVPYPFFGSHDISRIYRNKIYQLIQKSKTPMLIGSLDFIQRDDDSYDVTNAALFFNQQGFYQNKYEKMRRVPYGEFVPFREILPNWVIQQISMGRDLAAGISYAPLKILPDVRAGVAICYESIFAYGARMEALLGANLLLSLNNDAWYPKSSEPEQHLANALIRSVETRLPALRVGNNGGTLVINPRGEIESILLGTATTRGRKHGVLKVNLEKRPKLTFYSRFGDIFLLGLFFINIIIFFYILYNFYISKQNLIAPFKKSTDKD